MRIELTAEERAALDSRELGRLEGRLSTLEAQQRDLKEQQRDLSNRIDKELSDIKVSLAKETGDIKDSLEVIQDLMKQAEGAYKVGAWVVGLFGAIGGVIAWYWGIWK